MNSSSQQKPKPSGKLGLVLSGGGAKGVYEAGVLNALRLCQVHFDILVGSSVGSFNAATYAKVQRLQKGGNVDSANRFLSRILEFWLHAGAPHPIIDFDSPRPDGKAGLSGLIQELFGFPISLGLLAKLWWEYTDDRKLDLGESLDLARDALGATTGRALLGVLPSDLFGEFVRVAWSLRDGEAQRKLEAFLQETLTQFGLEKSLFGNDNLRRLFADPEVDLDKATLKEYYDLGTDARFSRTNIRTGRAEVSAYVPLERELTRARVMPPEGGANLKSIVGNPKLSEAALASGSFPVAFPPVSIEDIYPYKQPPPDPNDANNALKALFELFEEVDPHRRHPSPGAVSLPEPTTLEVALARSPLIQRGLALEWARHWLDLYPVPGDTYTDGGATDVTPLGAAIDAIHDAALDTLTAGASDRFEALCQARHHLIFVLLSEEPRIDEWESGPVTEMYSYQVGLRAQRLQSLSKEISDNRNAGRIRRLLATVAALQEKLGCRQGGPPASACPDQTLCPAGYCVKTEEGRIRLTEIEVIPLYPEEMPTWVLGFNQRLGYSEATHRRMIAMGCRNGLSLLYRLTQDDLEQHPEHQEQWILGEISHQMAEHLAKEDEGSRFCRLAHPDSTCPFAAECQGKPL